MLSDQQKYERNIKLYYLRSFFGSLGFTRAVFIIYLLSKGLNNAQVGSLQSLFFISGVVFEVPTGFIADKWGRRWSVLLSYATSLFWGSGMLLFCEYWQFFAIFLIQGLGKALNSGSEHALIYDSLHALEKREKYGDVFSRTEAIASIALGIGILSGGFLKIISWNWVFLASIAASCIAAVTVWLSTETLEHHADPRTAAKSIRVSDIFKFLFRDTAGRCLLLLMTAYAVFESIMSAYFIYGQTLFTSYKFETYHVGIVFLFSQVFSALAYASAGKIVKRFSTSVLGMIIIGASIPLLALHGIVGSTGAIILFFVLNFPPEILYTAVHVQVQDKIPKEMRASLLSVFAFFNSIAIGMAFLIIGILFDYIAIPTVLSYSSIVMVIALIMFFIYSKCGNCDEKHNDSI